MTAHAPPTAEEPQGRVRQLWDVIRSDRRLFLATLMLTTLAFIAIFGPALTPHAPEDIGLGELLSPPSWAHPMGLDNFGRDQLSRVIAGARISLVVALTIAGGSILVGFPVGLFIGYKGGLIDQIAGRVLDSIFAFPSLLLALVMTAILGPGLRTVVYALLIVYIPIVARVIRSAVIGERQRDYIIAARVMGVPTRTIVTRHLGRNVASPVLVLATLIMAFAVLAEAALSYLGFGAQPPTASWGKMLTENSPYIFAAPFLSIFPGLAIAYFVLALNLLGDGLRDHMDPRLRDAL